jgi:carbon-monoxide dehydrogenase large subunit
MSLIGARVLRKEDPNLLTGRGQFVDDITLAGTAVMTLVTSIEPHARIVGIDTAEAKALPGVLAVWTAADVAEFAPLGLPGLGRPLLATDVVRFVGEPVAVVVAENRYIATDAAQLVVVDYEPLPAVASLSAALADGAPALHSVLGGNTVFEQPFVDDLEAEFAAAPHTATLHLVNNRCAAVPIEPNACLADWGPSGLTLWATFQAPHHLRNTIAAYFGIAQDTTRVITPDVGGGFGAKINFVPEYFLSCALSRVLGRPVKYTQTRSECQVLMYHGRAQEEDVDVAYDDEGRLLALRVRVTQDQGAYPDPTGMGLPVLTTAMAAGCYKIPKVAISWRNVVTNTTPVAAYRGAGRPEASYLIERIIDLVADQSGIDPVEVRRRNFVPANEFPYATHSPLAVYDSGNYPAAMDTLLSLFDYEGLKAEQARRRETPGAKLIGIGFSSWLEIAAFGPPGSLEGFGHLGSWESAQVRIQPDGSAIVYTGASPHGQGTVTTFAQIASSELGIPFDKISVRHGDTATIPQGVGTMGSRATAVGGEGVRTASTRVVERAKAIAGHLLEADPADIVIEGDGFAVNGSPARSVPWSEVAWKSFRPLEIPGDTEPGSLDVTVFQQVPNFSFPSGAYCCTVEIDPGTGNIEITGMYLVDDCGTVINPLLAEGQVHGGVAQGIAQALYEGIRYDDNGVPQTSTLMDYLIPAATELPNYIDGRVNTPTPNNSLGAKGIGESGSVGTPPAVVNAVVDALSHLGVRHLDMPVTPLSVWNVLQEAK